MKVIGIIPARYESSRLPGKPLYDIAGLPMIVHVYRRACLSPVLDDVIVATDDARIKDAVEKYGGKAVLTRKHRNGHERAAEVGGALQFDIAVVICGDEPLLNPDHIHDSVQALVDSRAECSVLVLKFEKRNSPSDLKVVTNVKNEVLFFSRHDIPSDAHPKCPVQPMLKACFVTSFSRALLLEYATMEQTPMELREDNDHLRIIENGHRMVAKEVESCSTSVDTLEDLEYVRTAILKDGWMAKYA